MTNLKIKSRPIQWWRMSALGVLSVFAVGCQTQPSVPPTALPTLPKLAEFSTSKKILEQNCVHCHGTVRLAHMPAMDSTAALATLIGPGKWIVPGQPEQSRFFQVVTLADDQVGAMPPTGHAISPAETAAFKAWILAGAPIPPEDAGPLTPKGTPPRSR